MYCGQRPSRKKVWRFSRSLIIPIRLLNTNTEGRLYIKIGQVLFKSGSRVGNYAGIKGTRFRVWKITEMFQSWDSADKRVPVCRTLEKVCSCSLPGGVSRLSRRERQLINTLLLFVLSLSYSYSVYSTLTDIHNNPKSTVGDKSIIKLSVDHSPVLRMESDDVEGDASERVLIQKVVPTVVIQPTVRKGNLDWNICDNLVIKAVNTGDLYC